jgi:SAM-dependent methyltransferase
LANRPAGVHYVGLDISQAELQLAPEGSYHEVFVEDVANTLPLLVGKFDLIVSFQVLEHVKSLDSAFMNIQSYLKPGGTFVAQFSGAFSLFGLVNRFVPHSLGRFAMEKLLDRRPDTVFPAYYHHCWYSKIEELLSGWERAQIVPRYIGAGYLRFARPLQSAYLLFEDWAMKGNHADLATHYLIEARNR